ncbi:MAG: 50S ribosomal protein L2 [Candidatus Bathyarchaeota archaeon]
MGKRIRVQRRGRGGSNFRAATHKRVAPAKYPVTPESEAGLVTGVVEALVHDPGRGAPLARIRCHDGRRFFNIAPEGISVGQELQIGSTATRNAGNTAPLSEMSEGTLVYNIERNPGDGGKIVRSSGAYATIIAHMPSGTVLKLPSGKKAQFNGRCRATVGVVASGGRTSKPFMKAGEKFHLMKAKGHTYPTTKGVSMISALHPHGGGRHKHLGKSSTVARGTPPGRKVGLIAARQSGRAKKVRVTQ